MTAGHMESVLASAQNCWADRNREAYMVQISGFVFAPLMRDPLKPLPVPQLRAGWPQISFGLVACMD